MLIDDSEFQNVDTQCKTLKSQNFKALLKLESDTQESSLRSPSFEAKRTKDGALPSVRLLPRFSTTSFVLRGQQKKYCESY
jgi:hypothetical protein